MATSYTTVRKQNIDNNIETVVILGNSITNIFQKKYQFLKMKFWSMLQNPEYKKDWWKKFNSTKLISDPRYVELSEIAILTPINSETVGIAALEKQFSI